MGRGGWLRILPSGSWSTFLCPSSCPSPSTRSSTPSGRSSSSSSSQSPSTRSPRVYLTMENTTASTSVMACHLLWGLCTLLAFLFIVISAGFLLSSDIMRQNMFAILVWLDTTISQSSLSKKFSVAAFEGPKNLFLKIDGRGWLPAQPIAQEPKGQGPPGTGCLANL